jgi:hypothetical protein
MVKKLRQPEDAENPGTFPGQEMSPGVLMGEMQGFFFREE